MIDEQTVEHEGEPVQRFLKVNCKLKVSIRYMHPFFEAGPFLFHHRWVIFLSSILIYSMPINSLHLFFSGLSLMSPPRLGGRMIFFFNVFFMFTFVGKQIFRNVTPAHPFYPDMIPNTAWVSQGVPNSYMKLVLMNIYKFVFQSLDKIEIFPFYTKWQTITHLCIFSPFRAPRLIHFHVIGQI